MHADGPPDASAWHEAGHALVAHLLGARVRCVTLESELDDHDGHSEIEWRVADPRERAERSAKAALGGPLAELAFRGEDDLQDPDVLAAWAGDWTEVQRAAGVVEGDPRRRAAVVRAWIADVAALLADRECDELVARVADALHAHGTLDADGFLDAIDAS